MSVFDREIETAWRRSPRRWTGWTILLVLFGFFGTVFAVNGVMIYEALSTLSGVDTDSAYQAGLQFEQEVAAAKAQDARRWRVDAKLTPSAGGELVEVSARDAAGQPLGGMQASALFERPTDRRLDRNVELIETAAGRYRGNAEVAAGQWDIVIELTRQGEQMFRSKNRIILK